MKIYTVCVYVNETEVPEDNWEDIDFERADEIAADDLHWIIEHNHLKGACLFRHYLNEEDAINHVEGD